MKKYITLLALVVSTAIVAQGNKSVVSIERKPTGQNQTKYSGYQYVLSDDKFYEFKYTRSYSTDNNNFITKYLIYHPTTGRVVLTVRATHIPDEKKVVVDVEDPNGSIFSHINSEEIEYDSPSMAEFGFRGS